MSEERNIRIKKGLKLIEKIQFFALVLASLALIAGVDIITADIGVNLFKDPYFYVKNVITDTALLMLTFGTVYLVLDFLKESDKTYIDTKNRIDTFALSRDNIPTILSRFLEYTNRKRKIIQYKYNILMKLYALDNRKKWYAYVPFIRIFIRNPNYYTEEEMHLWNFGTDEEKASSKYCRKRKIYEEQLDDKLIDKVIDSTYVVYDKITTSTILSEYYSKDSNIVVNDFITKNESGRIARFRVPTLLLTFGATFLVTSLVLDGITFNMLALVTIGTKALSIIWNIYTSYRYAKKHFSEVTLHDILFRGALVNEYYKWMNQESEKNQKAVDAIPLITPVVKEETSTCQ